MKEPLTPKQQRFVDEYLADLSATKAAVRAGYGVPAWKIPLGFDWPAFIRKVRRGELLPPREEEDEAE